MRGSVAIRTFLVLTLGAAALAVGQTAAAGGPGNGNPGNGQHGNGDPGNGQQANGGEQNGDNNDDQNPPRQRVTGHWFGYFASSLTRETGPFDLVIATQRESRFTGTLFSPTLPMPIPFEGRFTGEHQRFVVIGRASPQLGFLVHGTVKWFNDGVGQATADYVLMTPAGIDKGSLLFEQSFDTAAPAQLPSHLVGDFVRDDGQKGMISVDLRQKGVDFEGVGMFGNLAFPFRSTIGAFPPGPPNQPGAAPVHAISVSPFATIRIDALFYPPGPPQAPQPHLDGMVTATFGDGSVHTATFRLNPPSPIAGA